MSLSLIANAPLYPGKSSGEVRNDYAFAAIQTDGSVVAWGDAAYGGNSSQVAAQLNGTIPAVEVFSSAYSFAALRSDGSVVTWGAISGGGDQAVYLYNDITGSYTKGQSVAGLLDGTVDVVKIFSTASSFAALRSDGSVVTWGADSDGGSSAAVASKLDGSTKVVDIFSSVSAIGSAFAALRADGSVVTWGEPTRGGDSSSVAAQLDGTLDVSTIQARFGVFTALRSDGSVISWGDSLYQSSFSRVSSLHTVTALYSTLEASAALLIDGSVVTWGNSGNGGDMGSKASSLDGTVAVHDIVSTQYAFAAIRVDGSVITWGDSLSGGKSSAVSSLINGDVDVLHIVATQEAFAALRADGSVVTWGSASNGGDSSLVASQLNGAIPVTSLFANDSAFAALRSDGSVVTWGKSSSGGESSAVSAQLNGTIDVVDISTTGDAFAALRADGTVVAWGNTQDGGLAPNLTHVASLATPFTTVAPTSSLFELNGAVTFWKTGTPLADVTSTLTSVSVSGSDTFITAADGLYHHLDVAQGSYTMTSAKVVGTDISSITASDALAALKIAVGINPNGGGSAVSPYQYLAADVNHDGKVSAADALNILKMSVKLPNAPVKEWLFVPDTVGSETMSRTLVTWPDAVTSITLDHNQELHLIGIFKGDVNGSAQVL